MIRHVRYKMLAGELINNLNYLIETHGNLPIFIEHENNSKVVITTIADIGFVIGKSDFGW
jgi:hypothetical protein